MDVVLIACSKGKQRGGTTEYSGSALESVMPSLSFAQLLSARSELRGLLDLAPGPDLGCPNGVEPVQYLPAYQRYDGTVYRRGGVSTLYPRASHTKLLIVSALYGLLDADDPIRCYELHMKGMLPGGRTVHTWWKHRDLGTIMEECLLALKPERVHDLLPTTYRPSLEPWPPASLREAGIGYTPYDYTREGMGSDSSRGTDLERLLQSASADSKRDVHSPHCVAATSNRISTPQVVPSQTELARPKGTEEIRQYVLHEIIEPAREKGDSSVTIRATDIAHGLDLRNRYPVICNALDRKFEQYAHVRLLERNGKPQSSAVTWTFEV